MGKEMEMLKEIKGKGSKKKLKWKWERKGNKEEGKKTIM